MDTPYEPRHPTERPARTTAMRNTFITVLLGETPDPMTRASAVTDPGPVGAWAAMGTPQPGPGPTKPPEPFRRKTSPARAAGKPASLTREEIVDAAMTLVDEVGLDALTMRAVADRLGVYPNALYWHIGSRSA